MSAEAIRTTLRALKIPRHEARIELRTGLTTYARVLGFVGDDRVEVLERSSTRTRVFLIREIAAVELLP